MVQNRTNGRNKETELQRFHIALGHLNNLDDLLLTEFIRFSFSLKHFPSMRADNPLSKTLKICLRFTRQIQPFIIAMPLSDR